MSDPGASLSDASTDDGLAADESASVAETPASPVSTSETPPPMGYPAGHFYSPVVDIADVTARADEIWPAHAPRVLGVDMRPEEHRRILTEVFPKYVADYDYVQGESDARTDCQYYSDNSQFGWLDSRTLFVFLREFRPKRIIEVGSGFSSLLTADVNTRWFGGGIDFTCIEPYPRPFLEKGVPGISRLVTERVERLDTSFFGKLDEGDVLFIDSSHVSKTGSDVNYLLFEVLPRLKPGVRIHVHDVFLPRDYPQSWVLEEHRSWNEQYVLRALLMYSTAFRVLFGCACAFELYPSLVEAALGLPAGGAYGGGSLWIERT